MAAETQPRTPQVFISYSHKDKKWLERLETHLAPLLRKGALTAWSDQQIQAAQEWRREIEAAILAARAAVLLVSPHFLASKFIAENELPPLLEAAEKRGLTILWVAVSASLYQEERFAKYQGVNNPSQPLNSLTPAKRDAELVQVAQQIKKAMEGNSPPASERAATLFNVPYERNPAFTGRQEVLTQLRAKLVSNSATALSQLQALSGLGGIGKTQAAVEYTYRHRDDYKAIFWVAAETEQTLSTGFVAMAQLLRLPGKDTPEQDQVRQAVLRWLESQDRWLVVFDNADQPELLKNYLPHQHRGHVLLTSRAQVFQSAGLTIQPISLEKLHPDEAREFLLRRTGRASAETAELKAAEELASELDYLPLALEQAAAFLMAKQSRFQDYLVSFDKRRLELLERHGPVTGSGSVRTDSPAWYREANG